MTVTDILLSVNCFLIAALAVVIWRGMDNLYGYLETIYYDRPGNVMFPVGTDTTNQSKGRRIMENPNIEGDTRADDIQNARGDKVALGTFYITDEGRGVEFQLVNPEYLDVDTFAACMVQLIAHAMNANPEASQMSIMLALQQAMNRAMADELPTTEE